MVSRICYELWDSSEQKIKINTFVKVILNISMFVIDKNTIKINNLYKNQNVNESKTFLPLVMKVAMEIHYELLSHRVEIIIESRYYDQRNTP